MNTRTLCIHGGSQEVGPYGSISVPIYQTATFAHIGVGESTGYDYTRMANPTRTELETILMKLERGADALAFATGMAAITAMMELYSPGDHLIASDDLYGGSYRLFEHISKKNGITVDYIDTTSMDEIRKHILPNTKGIYLETPTNPMMKVASIRDVSNIAKEHNLLLMVDNTFLTPYFMNPILLGANIVIHSGTNYLCGHNDTLAGFLVVDSQELSERLRFIYKTTGGSLAPFDSWLLIRGIKTLGIRMEQQQKNALAIANWLKDHPKINRVHYVGLPSHPDYEISVGQSTGFGGMISFETRDEATAIQLLEKVKIILYAESLGGVESLITYPMLQTHGDIPKKIREKLGINECLLRISVGIEDVEDLIEDLSQGLK